MHFLSVFMEHIKRVRGGNMVEKHSLADLFGTWFLVRKKAEATSRMDQTVLP